MSNLDTPILPEEDITHWRQHLESRRAMTSQDAGELEDHLRSEMESLMKAGLSGQEAFMVAIGRLGSMDSLSAEYAREHSGRLWKQLVLVRDEPAGTSSAKPVFPVRTVMLAAGAALSLKIPSLFVHGSPAAVDAFYMRNLAILVLPFLALFFLSCRRQDKPVPMSVIFMTGGIFLLAGFAANAYPMQPEADTLMLLAVHLPLLAWFAVGAMYPGNGLKTVTGRMDFVRFSGEFFIYYVLMALGGGVLVAFSALVFGAIGYDFEPVIESWMVPCGAGAAVIMAAWLVEEKKSVIENMAPVLTRIFSPLFAMMLLAFLGSMVVTGRGISMERDILIAFDLLLVMVLALFLYSISAREPAAPPAPFDVIQLALLLAMLATDALALMNISSRIVEYGTTPNRLAALGLNLLVLVNLGRAALLQYRFIRGKTGFASIEKWQTDYMPLYAVWAALVVFVFPPLFGFV